METEKKIITIKSAVQPVGGGLYHKAFMSMPRGGVSIKTAVLSSSFQSEGKKPMVAETMEEYVLDSTEVAYENPG